MRGPVVNLIVMNPNQYGGTITYTAHLFHALSAAGARCMIYKLGGSGGAIKDYGYGCPVRSQNLAQLKRLPGITMVTACIGKEFEAPTLELLGRGAFVTVHDPNDLKNFEDLSWTSSNKIVVIRPNNRGPAGICPNATFIPHPFVRHFVDGDTPRIKDRPRHALTLSRLGSIKKTTWILEANRLLPDDRKIWLRGYDDRFYTHHQIVSKGKFPEFRQDSDLPPDERKTFGKVMGEAQRLAATAKFLVDLTDIKGDGGGTQYTFLEALDAGCCLVLNRAWIRPDGLWDPGVNCLCVTDSQDLAKTLADPPGNVDAQIMADKAREILPNHEPGRVARLYLDFLLGA